MAGGGEDDPILVASVRDANLEATVHALPCRINFDGTAPISSYFLPSTKEVTGATQSKDLEMEAQFRGRDLRGRVLPLPSETVGVILRESAVPSELATNGEFSRFWSVESEFREMTLWNHDSYAPEQESLAHLKDWYAVSKAIHED